MQAVAIRGVVALNVQKGGARRALGGQQLRRAAANGARCRAFFKFGGDKEKEKTGGVASDQQYFKGVRRDDFQASDVQDYFMYMGMLASEGSYDRCEAMLASGTAPVDLLLLMACSEGDDGKVVELLDAGADPNIKDLDGRTPLEIATKEEVREILLARGSQVAA